MSFKVESYERPTAIKPDEMLIHLADYPLPLINSWRRFLIAEYPTVSVEHEAIEFETNTSVLTNEYLARRLALICVNNDKLSSGASKYKPEEITVNLAVKNTSPEPRYVYAEDFVFQTPDGKSLPNFFTYPKTIFALLKQNQEIKLKAPLEDSWSRLSGAWHTPCQAILTYHDPRDEEPEDYLDIPKNKHGDPRDLYIYLEGVGIQALPIIVKESTGYYIEKLQHIEKVLAEANPEKVVIAPTPADRVSFTFTFEHEDDTLGNLVASYCNRDTDAVAFSGYRIPHPADDQLAIEIGLKDASKNTKDGCTLYFINLLKSLVKDIEKLQAAIKKAL